MVAADACSMQIEWREGAAWRCAETARQSKANDTVRTEACYCEKMLRRECLEKLEEEIGSAIRRRTVDRGEARRVFVM